MITLAGQIEIADVKNGSNETTEYYIGIPPEAKATGVCGKKIQSITLQWNTTVNAIHNVTFIFATTDNTTKYDLSHVKVNITADNSTVPSFNGELP